MGFGAKNVQTAAAGVDRLAAVAGSSSFAAPPADAAASSSAPRRRDEVRPDPSRIRPRQLEESPDQRKRRLAAKTANFTATIIARIVIIVAAALWAWNQYQFTGQLHRGVAIGVFVMLGDFGRVILKATEAGTK